MSIRIGNTIIAGNSQTEYIQQPNSGSAAVGPRGIVRSLAGDFFAHLGSSGAVVNASTVFTDTSVWDPIGDTNVQSDWAATSGDSFIRNKPTTISTAQANAITANTAKVGITPAQATAITGNTAKVGITPAQASAIVANTAKQTALTSSNIVGVINSSTGTISIDRLPALNFVDAVSFATVALRNASTRTWAVGDLAIITTSPIESYIYTGTPGAGPTDDDDFTIIHDTDTTLTAAQVLARLNQASGSIDADLLGNGLQLGTSSTTALAGNTTTITGAQATAITNNTAKVGITPAQATAITNNTAKVGITTAQSNAITANTAKVTFPGFGTSSTTALRGDTSIPTVAIYTGQTASGNYTIPLRDSGNTAIKFLREDGDWVEPPGGGDDNVQSDWDATSGDAFILNKPTTITSAQATAIAANTSKVGITTAQASAITANSAKVGITTAQASAITTNSAKVGITTAQSTKLAGIETGAEVNVTPDWDETSASDDSFIANKPTTITTAQSSAIVLNTAKVGITPGQAAAIVTNTAKDGVDSVYTGQTANGVYSVPVRDSGNTSTKFLREDGDWVVPTSSSSGGGNAVIVLSSIAQTIPAGSIVRTGNLSFWANVSGTPNTNVTTSTTFAEGATWSRVGNPPQLNIYGDVASRNADATTAWALGDIALVEAGPTEVYMFSGTPGAGATDADDWIAIHNVNQIVQGVVFPTMGVAGGDLFWLTSSQTLTLPGDNNVHTYRPGLYRYNGGPTAEFLWISAKSLEADEVDTGNIVDGAITTPKLRDLGVTGAKIANGTIEVAKLATNLQTVIVNNSNKVGITTAQSTKLAGIAAGAEVNVNADWDATTGDAFILNKPNHLDFTPAGTSFPASPTVGDYFWLTANSTLTTENVPVFYNTGLYRYRGGDPNTVTFLWQSAKEIRDREVRGVNIAEDTIVPGNLLSGNEAERRGFRTRIDAEARLIDFTQTRAWAVGDRTIFDDRLYENTTAVPANGGVQALLTVRNSISFPIATMVQEVDYLTGTGGVSFNPFTYTNVVSAADYVNRLMTSLGLASTGGVLNAGNGLTYTFTRIAPNSFIVNSNRLQFLSNTPQVTSQILFDSGISQGNGAGMFGFTGSSAGANTTLEQSDGNIQLRNQNIPFDPTDWKEISATRVKATWKVAQFVSAGSSTITGVNTLITKRVIEGNNQTEDTWYGFIYNNRLEIWTTINQTAGTRLLVQNFTG